MTVRQQAGEGRFASVVQLPGPRAASGSSVRVHERHRDRAMLRARDWKLHAALAQHPALAEALDLVAKPM